MAEPKNSSMHISKEYSRILNFDAEDTVLNTSRPPSRGRSDGKENAEDRVGQRYATTAGATRNRGTENIQDKEEMKVIIKRVIQYPEDRWSKHVNILAEENYRRRRKMDDPNAPFKTFAILLRKVLSASGKLEEICLEIQSEALCQVLREVGRPVQNLINLEVCPIIFKKPYKPLLYLQQPLEEALKDTKFEESTRAEIQLLLDFIYSPDGLKESVQAFRDQIKLGRVSYGLLWALYPAEAVVYYNDGTEESCGLVESVEYTAMNFQITVVQGNHSGNAFGLERSVWTVLPFPGLYDINNENLELVPLKCLKEERQRDVRRRLIERGRLFCELHEQTWAHKDYEGPFWAFRPDVFQRSLEGSKRVQIKGRIMIDSRALARLDLWAEPDFVSSSLKKYLRENQRTALEDASDSDSNFNGAEDELEAVDETKDKVEQAMQDRAFGRTEEEYVLCSPRIRCFFLNERQWGTVLVDYLKEPNWAPGSFSHLQMRPSLKSLIETLVQGFNPDTGIDFEDTVKGKGRGLIFLLHGDPGLGKTMTAETIAEHTKRPLLHVTTGHLGIDIAQVEKQLGEIFMLGYRWGAVVLLDEADVLMSQRTLGDLHRNAIVAVFLRLIEYYSGLLFLTTNRLEGFDTAFYNRIHVKIKYPKLDKDARTNIWRNLLQGSRSSITLSNSWTKELYPVLGGLTTNGRDIRNIIRLAHGIAAGRDGGRSVTVDDIVDAVKINCSEESSDKIEEIDQVIRKIQDSMKHEPENGRADSSLPSRNIQ